MNKMIIRTPLTLVVAGIAFLASPSVVAASPQQISQQAFDKGLIPSRLQLGGAQCTLRRGYQAGRISFTAVHKRLIIDWTSSSLTNLEPDWATYSVDDNLGLNSRGLSKYRSEQQVIPAGFYITACGRLDDTSLLVAGINRKNGGAIVERWVFDWPSASAIPVNDAFGYNSVAIVTPGVLKTRIYSDSPLQGATHKYISGVCGLRDASLGTPTNVLVQFDNPNDVFVLNISTSQLTLLSSQSSGSGTLGMLASLSIGEYSGIKIMNHTSAGYIYFFASGSIALSSPYGGTLIDDSDVRMHFVDSDRDGVLDSALEMSTIQAQSSGYLNLSNYENWWLE